MKYSIPIRNPKDAAETLLVELKAELFRRQEVDGCWRGRLSGSALSTAVGLFALAQVDSDKYRNIIRAGSLWLRDNVNEDGGWGDTVVSKSNLSTTLLVWAALGFIGGGKTDFKVIVKCAESWIEGRIGGLKPDQIILAVEGHYGKDKTFAVPILAMLTMAGCLGPLPQTWGKVSQLPFEVSVLPQSFFRWLRLPVGSYALPALIAIGVVRHVMAPSRNPVARLIRNIVLTRSLKILEKIQPANGGFLEATPLTGFVVMSLVTAGYGDYLVVERGTEFLVDSIRDNGSWPIDTDLATWVTTLAVNAVDVGNDLSIKKRDGIKSWLLNQQFKEKHPFTGAAPGGWGWTDLPGSVPDADDTAGVLLALKKLSATDDVKVKRAAEAGLDWLLGVQNRDGGIPTFCKGWGILPFDMSCPDITAHAISAISAWEECMDKKIRHRLERAKKQMLHYLEKTQEANGAWVPLWFGNEHAAGAETGRGGEGERGRLGEGESPVCGTARVLAGVAGLKNFAGLKRFDRIIGDRMIKECRSTEREKGLRKKRDERPISNIEYRTSNEGMVEAGYRLLCKAQNVDGGWGGDAGIESSVEETALAVTALSDFDNDDCSYAVERGIKWLVDKFADTDKIKATPIGLYFASLWYYEDMYPLVFAVSALQKKELLPRMHK